MFSLLISSFLPVIVIISGVSACLPWPVTVGSTDVTVNLSHFVHRRDTLKQQIASYVTENFHSPKVDISDELAGPGIIRCIKCHIFT